MKTRLKRVSKGKVALGPNASGIPSKASEFRYEGHWLAQLDCFHGMLKELWEPVEIRVSWLPGVPLLLQATGAARGSARGRGWCSREEKHCLPLKPSIQWGGERREAPRPSHYARHSFFQDFIYFVLFLEREKEGE